MVTSHTPSVPLLHHRHDEAKNLNILGASITEVTNENHLMTLGWLHHIGVSVHRV